MGKSDPVLWPFYEKHIKPQGKVALLGFTNNNWFDGDLYDLQLNNWNINDNWALNGKYDTIISLRCPYFAENPEDFIVRCHNNLNDGGKLYVDWGFGDHWRFKNYKVGWLKNGEQEYAYKEDNFLWSGIWDDSFLLADEVQLFSERIKKFGYYNLKEAVFHETPFILDFNFINKYFDISYNTRTLWEYMPQLYIMVSGIKK